MTKQTNIFAEVVDEKAMEQFESAMAQPWAVKGALMPDVHMGYTLPIGAVVATEGMIVPAYIGFDIGCGVCAVKTEFIKADIERYREDIFNRIYKHVPVGFSRNDKEATPLGLYDYPCSDKLYGICDDRGGMYQLGTLGGGNHFIEIGTDESGAVWIIVHSGSRGVGHGVASHYMRLASGDGKAREGHFAFPVDGPDGRDYIADMEWCLKFALYNRKEIVDRVGCAISGVVYDTYTPLDFINRNHNHATERDGLWIHRKGATHAEDGMEGVIPGNMRDGSFIVRGKGNPDALWSSSHGAGRVLGRKEAKMVLSLEEFKESMLGVTAKVGEGALDESPMAYKDIFGVMELQKDLVDVVAHVKPIINIKG
jgi:tRNA-splicing ligase RtcB